MGTIFNDTTTAEIDARLHRDILEFEEKTEKAVIIIVLILLFIFRGSVSYWLKFGMAIPKRYQAQSVNTLNDPIITNYSIEEQNKKQFTYYSLLNKEKIVLKPLAHYEVSGTVVGKHYNSIFFFKGNEKHQLYTLGLVWGKISDQSTLNEYFRISTSSNGGYSWNAKYNVPYSTDYISSHINNFRIIPANNNVMAAMLKLKDGSKVKIEGEVLQFYAGRIYSVYVKKVQIGNNVYE